MTKDEILFNAAHVLPSRLQYDWMEMELTAFVHFSLNTFYDREWGDGSEDMAVFNPAECDPREWVKLFAECGFKMAILTCKHHGGFCLWPSAYTSYSIKNTPWKGGKGDLVKEFSDACAEFGVKFGIYLSPWDRHEECYGDSPRYNEYFKNQLRELLTNYGKVSCVWFDGACVPKKGKVQVYDWDGFYALIRELQPEALLSGVAPDIRWCGNEAGECRRAEWAVLNVDKSYARFNSENCQKTEIGDPGDGEHLMFYPAEVDTSLRPNWFYHICDDSQVKSLPRLVNIYCNSVGHNSVLLLNVPPDCSGRIAPGDAARLREFCAVLKEGFSNDLLADGETIPGEELSYKFKSPQTKFNMVVLQEDILHHGQRVESYKVDVCCKDGSWLEVAEGCTIGHKEIVRFPAVCADRIRVRIISSRHTPVLKPVQVYLFPDVGEDSLNVYEEVLPVDAVRLTASSEDNGYSVQNLAETLPSFPWKTAPDCDFPHWIMAELVTPGTVRGFTVLPGSGEGDKLIREWCCKVSSDGIHWHIAAFGEFQNWMNNPIFQRICFKEKEENVRFIRLEALNGYTSSPAVALNSFRIIPEN